MNPYQPQGRPSLRGRLLRKTIAYGVLKKAGGDILGFARERQSDEGPELLPPPAGWLAERHTLPSGGGIQYLLPPRPARSDIAILQIHGGGYTLGFWSVFQRFAPRLAHLGGEVPVLSLDYRLAPEHPYPAALDDACEALTWLRENKGIPPEAVAAIGESAGAGLALALAMRLRDESRGRDGLRALVLMSPLSDLTGQSNSFVSRHHLDPFFGSHPAFKNPPPFAERSRALPFKEYVGAHDVHEPYISPAFGHYDGLPPMLIHVGEYEMLYDDAVTVHRKAVAAGVPAVIKVWAGMFHAFQLAGPLLPEARQAWREIGRFLRQQLGTSKRADKSA